MNGWPNAPGDNGVGNGWVMVIVVVIEGLILLLDGFH